MSNLNNEIRNKLTEHQNNYKLCNLNLMNCYAGLYPATLTKLSLVIFNQILSNKIYHNRNSKFYDLQEDKRIHTNTHITPASLLENCHPTKYRFDKKDTSKDAGNIVRRIYELDENNIFYVWRCGYPKNYMFVLERDIGLWKFYNPNAYVTPKTIKKIVTSTKGMCNGMYKILEEDKNNFSIHDVRNSFCKFVSGIVDKMHPDVSKKLDKWDKGRGYKEYLINLNKKVSELDAYEGFEEDKNFHDRLPIDVKTKLVPKKREKKTYKELESSLVPEEENLVKKKKVRKTKQQKNAEAKVESFKSSNPLNDTKSFIQFYRGVIKSHNNNADFHDYIVESNHASIILDLIKDNGHDEAFLRSWISFYADLKLKGNHIIQKDKTSLRLFKETYEDYTSRYIGCGV